MKALQVSSRFEEQSAFVGLLTRQLVTPANEPRLHRLVMRYHRTLTESFRRYGYKLVIVGHVVRLYRLLQAAEAAAPPCSAPPRSRELVLTLAAAAACEEGESSTTLQGISDAVRLITSAPGSAVTPYDERYAERIILRRAAHRLEHHGVLIRRTRDEDMLRDWVEDHSGIGAGYDIDRSALLQFADPHTLATAIIPPMWSGEQDVAGTRWIRMLRLLLETPALHYCDLSEDDAAYARSVAGRLAEAVARDTGGTVEIRAEGMVLILGEDHLWSGDATLDWPTTSCPAWIALQMCDAAGAIGEREPEGRTHLTSREVDDLADLLHQRHHAALTKAFREHPETIRLAAEEFLTDAGLLRISTDGSWVLLPAAARYRADEPGVDWYRTEQIREDETP